MEPRLIPIGSLRVGHIVFMKQENALNISGIVTAVTPGSPAPKLIALVTPLGSTMRFNKKPLKGFSDAGLCIEGEVYVVNAFDCVSNKTIKKATSTPPPSS